MVGLIQKSGFIKPGKAAGYIKYIATRDGVEKIGADGYLEYMATRPGSHGLFGSQPVVSLDAVMKEAEQHTGPVWTLIYSLHREDAARLGYDNAESWRKLIKAHQVELATAMKIPPEQFRWYAAYHDADTHPHIHMTVWSDNPKLGFLTPDGIKAMRSVLTNSIFQDELYSLYKQKDISYKELTAQARTSMRELVRQMESSLCDSPVIEMQMLQLSRALKNVSGKKVYGYLKKSLKEQVDTIVDELAKVPAVAECYEVWNDLRDELESYYKDVPRQHLPLSQQKEFKAIKNMVIQETENLRLGVVTFEDDRMQDEPLDRSRFSDPDVSDEDKRSVAEELAQNWEYNGSVSVAYQLGRVWRDGLGVLPDDEKAKVWFQRAADGGHVGAQYVLAKLLYEQGRTSEAIFWFEQAAKGGNPFASYQLGKLYLAGGSVPKDVLKALEYLTETAEQGNSQAQYILGKLYLLGNEVEQDREAAVQWMVLSAAKGHEYAQFYLDHMEQDRDPSVLLCATRLLCHMAQIIRDTPPVPPTGLVIDRKRFRQLMEKKIAMGHKPDDHEEQRYIGPAMWPPKKICATENKERDCRPLCNMLRFAPCFSPQHSPKSVRLLANSSILCCLPKAHKTEGGIVMNRKREAIFMGIGVLAGLALSGPAAQAATTITAILSSQPIYVDGQRVSMTAYNIGGNNYVRLRDIGKAVDFGVTYDAATNSVHIDPKARYQEEVATSAHTPVSPATSITEESVQATLWGLMEQYPNGTPYGAPYRSTSNGPYSGGMNCAGWATLCSDAAFGDLPWRRLVNPRWEDIQTGDLIRFDNNYGGHVVVVLDKTDEYILTTESGTHNKALWGGQYFRWWLEQQPGYTLYTRYPQ